MVRGIQRHADAGSARISNGHRSLTMIERGLHHVLKLVFIFGRHHRDIGEHPQIRKVEHTVVRGAVITDQATAVETKDHRKFLETNVVLDLVKRSLEKRGINGYHGFAATASKAGGEGD